MCVISTRRPSTSKSCTSGWVRRTSVPSILPYTPRKRGARARSSSTTSGVAKVAGVPYFVAVAQVMRNALVEVAVGVGKQANARHACKDAGRAREIGSAPYLAAAAGRSLCLFSDAGSTLLPVVVSSIRLFR